MGVFEGKYRGGEGGGAGCGVLEWGMGGLRGEVEMIVGDFDGWRGVYGKGREGEGRDEGLDEGLGFFG